MLCALRSCYLFVITRAQQICAAAGKVNSMLRTLGSCYLFVVMIA
jgi:hypothetical protein